MKNVIVCSNCNSENSFYKLNCSSCGALLRGKTVNIDLWSTIWKIFESPRKAFETIIFSEHKNFAVFILFLVSVKIFINTLSFGNLLKINASGSINGVLQMVLVIIVLLIYFNLFSIIAKGILELAGIETRFRDNISILTFSLVPYLIGLTILFPVEYALFGSHWLMFNPSPLMLKGTAAMVLFGIEGLLVLWGVFLSIRAMYVQSRSILFAVAIGMLFNAGTYLVSYLTIHYLNMIF